MTQQKTKTFNPNIRHEYISASLQAMDKLPGILNSLAMVRQPFFKFTLCYILFVTKFCGEYIPYISFSLVQWEKKQIL